MINNVYMNLVVGASPVQQDAIWVRRRASFPLVLAHKNHLETFSFSFLKLIFSLLDKNDVY